MFAVENNPKGRKNNAFVSEGYEYCLLYCKNKSHLVDINAGRVFCDIANEAKKDTRTVYTDQFGDFRQSKRQVSGANKSNALCKDSKADRCFTIYYCSATDDVQFEDEYDAETDAWFLSFAGQKLIDEGYVRYVCTNNQTGKPSIPLYSKSTLLEKHLAHGIFFKDDGTIYEKERDGAQQITSFLPNKRFGVDLMTESATKTLENIFGKKGVFNNAKNVEFIQLLLGLIRNKNAIILDSFGGSGTTAHAVLNLNKLDGNRKFILVEMMDYADSVTAERVKRVIDGYGKGTNAVEGTGGNFTFYDLGEPLLLPNGNLNEKVSVDKIREYVYYMETKEPVDVGSNGNPYFMGNSRDTAYYFFYEKDAITTLDHEFLTTIPERADGYIIYADLCVIPAEELTKYNITFKKIPRDIARL